VALGDGSEQQDAGSGVSAVRDAGAVGPLLESELVRRREAGSRFFVARSADVARLCHRMAERFARGGRLLAFGCSAPARSDVRHVAVEFVHPVIVGKRALPALGLAGDSAPVVGELELMADPEDIVIAFGEPSDGDALAAGIARARARGCLTVAFSTLGAEWELEPPSADPFIRQELVETTYHVLWELVHVFFEHRGLLEGRSEQRVHDVGASSFLYPFLGEREHDLDAVLADVRRSVLMKAEEVQELRGETLRRSVESLNAAAAALRGCFARGGRVLALGNGGSATDATDLVADLVAVGRPAIDLTADSAIITALANDIGPEAIFARQVIAYGREGDVLVTLSTSGNSLSVLDALAESRRRGLATVAFVGYDGGRVASDDLADHVVLSRSQHIPRIQEAQATAYHLLCRLVKPG
jgi:D-sedoheptulose 7-phosphate isomerase